MPTLTAERVPAVREDWQGMSDRDLLLAGRRAKIEQNRASAERWRCMAEFYARRLATEQARKAASPHFALTARQETVVEIGSLWGIDTGRVRKELNVALFLREHAPEIWQLCVAGELDDYRAMLVADAAREKLDEPDDIAKFSTRMLKFLQRHLTGVDGDPEAEPMVTCTVKQLRNAITYAMAKVRPAQEEADFRKAYAARDASAREDVVPGMGWLSINGRIDKVKLADHRLWLAARRRREAGDERTLAQLKSDLALDLLAGKEDAAPVPAYARPIVNLTVPIQTVMGLSDDPGTLSGGTVVPASVARMIAQEPGGTWQRMLTDEAGHLVELSTRKYRPTAPIWRHVVAEYPTCFRAGCDQSSTEADLDHRTEWPLGATDIANLWPGCRTDHRAKHAPGFGIEQADDGSYALRTAAGFRHPVERAVHPVSDELGWPGAEPEIQFSATEFRQAIEAIRECALEYIAPELLWEADFDEGLTAEQWDAAFGRSA